MHPLRNWHSRQVELNPAGLRLVMIGMMRAKVWIWLCLLAVSVGLDAQEADSGRKEIKTVIMNPEKYNQLNNLERYVILQKGTERPWR